MRRIRTIGVVVTLGLLCACVSQLTYPEGDACIAPNFAVTDNFEGARRGTCKIVTENHVELIISPEDQGKINDSPWYAFQVKPFQNSPQQVLITLNYLNGHHRYLPKISSNGKDWQALPISATHEDASKKNATITLPLQGQDIWLAAQPLTLPADMRDWGQQLAERTSLQQSVLGTSVLRHPIHILTHNEDADDFVMFVGGQHPPEVTGSYGLRGFIETLFAETELARKFRRSFGIVVIPMINPDGVINGHWRHNMRGADLNRDWGPFLQPETLLIKNYLDQLIEKNKSPKLFLDFHSTKRNVFYTQSDDDVTDPLGFSDRWLENSRPQIENYPFEQAKRHNKGLPTSKNYIYSRFGIPAITYEVDDQESFKDAQAAAAVFATEMMKILLAQPDNLD